MDTGQSEMLRAQWAGGERSTVAAMQIPILMYHSIDDEGPAALAPYRIPRRLFMDQMRFLRDAGFHTIGLDTWVAAIRERRPVPGRPIVITFDDGYRNFIDNAWPILESVGFSATMFVVTNKVGGVADWDEFDGPRLPLMSWNELRLLQANGLSLGSHTASHADLTSLARPEIVREGLEAKVALKRELGLEVQAVAPPWGRSDSTVQEALREAGYSIAVRTWGGVSTFDDNPLDLPRIEIFPDDDLQRFAQKIGYPYKGTSMKAPDDDTNPGAGEIEASPPGAERDKPKWRPDTVYPEHLAARLDSLLAQFVSLTTDILALQGRQAAIQQRILRIFQLSIAGSASSELKAYDPVDGRFAVGFQPEARVQLEVLPKADFTQSPENCFNILRLHMTGASRWLSLEFSCDWGELSNIERFQLGIYASVSRAISGRGVLRLPGKGGKPIDIVFAHFRLDPNRMSLNMSGEVPRFDYAGLDMSRQPTLFFDLNTADMPAFDMQLNYMSLYFV